MKSDMYTGLLMVKHAGNIVRHSNLAGNTLNFTTYILKAFLKEGFLLLTLKY